MNTHVDKVTAFYPVNFVLQTAENRQKNEHKQLAQTTLYTQVLLYFYVLTVAWVACVGQHLTSIVLRLTLST